MQTFTVIVAIEVISTLQVAVSSKTAVRGNDNGLSK